jgi:murein L,D-transpeptidase YafK
MLRLAYYLLMVLFFCSHTTSNDFLTEQKKYARVRAAINEKNERLTQWLKEKNIAINQLQILFTAYKFEKTLNVYVKNIKDSKYTLLKSYPICALSGALGPKRKQGDQQVPEGFYYIDRFNPSSSFHLSLGINYPNASDRIKSTATDLGGDIFIHGNCVSIGCLSMTDDYIKEIYLLSIYAKNNLQHKIPVYIFPYQMNEGNHQQYTTTYAKQPELIKFWNTLKTGYQKFEINKTALHYSINEKGEYTF